MRESQRGPGLQINTPGPCHGAGPPSPTAAGSQPPMSLGSFLPFFIISPTGSMVSLVITRLHEMLIAWGCPLSLLLYICIFVLYNKNNVSIPSPKSVFAPWAGACPLSFREPSGLGESRQSCGGMFLGPLRQNAKASQL